MTDSGQSCSRHDPTPNACSGLTNAIVLRILHHQPSFQAERPRHPGRSRRLPYCDLDIFEKTSRVRLLSGLIDSSSGRFQRSDKGGSCGDNHHSCDCVQQLHPSPNGNWRCPLLSCVLKYLSSVSFFRSFPNHRGSPVSRLLTTVRNLSFFPR